MQAVERRIESVDSSRTEITPTDGTKLVAPQRAVFTPGALAEGMSIVASYREENRAKVLTGIAVKDRAQRLAEARPADAASCSIGMAARSRAPASLDWRECS